MNKLFSILFAMVFIGCAASVSTEQYVGEYEKQKSLDEVEITKVDGLKIVEVKFNKEVEERYPELAEKRVVELNTLLSSLISDELHIHNGKKILEVKNSRINKGFAASKLVE